MNNDSRCKVIGIGSITVMVFDSVSRTLSNVKHAPKVRRSLISFVALDNLGYDFFKKNVIMNINKGSFIVMKGKKVKKLYTLTEKTIGGAKKVEPYHEESF